MSSNEKFVWLNGRLTPLGEAVISPFDRGYQVGFGAFETMHARDGRVFAITRHWQRLCHSCQVLGMTPPELPVFADAIQQSVQANPFHDARVRFTISRSGEGGVTMLVTVVEAPVYDGEARVASVPWPRNELSPLGGVKSLSYADNVLGLEHAMNRGAGEAVFGNTRGELCEGAGSNVFLVPADGDVLVTPPLEAGCLPGVMRGLVIELAEANGIPIEQKAVPFSSLSQAREAFLTSSTRYVQAISHVDDQPLSRSPGPCTVRLSELLNRWMNENFNP